MSLVLCLATASAYSYLCVREWYETRAHGIIKLEIFDYESKGWGGFCSFTTENLHCRRGPSGRSHVLTSNMPTIIGADGFFVSIVSMRYEGSRDSGLPPLSGTRVALIIRPTYLLVLFAILPAIALLLWLLPKRPGPGHCRCGYVLTGNVSGVCPECGTKVMRSGLP